MIVVDASVLIAFLDPTDAHHQRAIDGLAQHAPPYVVHPLTAAEVLVQPAMRGRAADVWSRLSAAGCELDDAPLDPFRLAQTRADSGLRLPDCCVLMTARRRGVPVLTFDRQLARAAQD